MSDMQLAIVAAFDTSAAESLNERVEELNG